MTEKNLTMAEWIKLAPTAHYTMWMTDTEGRLILVSLDENNALISSIAYSVWQWRNTFAKLPKSAIIRLFHGIIAECHD